MLRCWYINMFRLLSSWYHNFHFYRLTVLLEIKKNVVITMLSSCSNFCSNIFIFSWKYQNFYSKIISLKTGVNIFCAFGTSGKSILTQTPTSVLTMTRKQICIKTWQFGLRRWRAKFPFQFYYSLLNLSWVDIFCLVVLLSLPHVALLDRHIVTPVYCVIILRWKQDETNFPWQLPFNFHTYSVLCS